MRRRLGLLLFVFGLVAVVVGTASGCGTFFSFNGRHPVAVAPLAFGTPMRATFPAKHGMRYTLAVQIVYEREDLAVDNGLFVVDADVPLVASIEDSSGVAVAKVVGSIDPSQPPNTIWGADANPNQRRPAGIPPAEVVAERLVGSITAPVDRDVSYAVNLGLDRKKAVKLKEARVVIFDDKLPTSITIAFVAAGFGAVALFMGSFLLVLGLFARRRGVAARRKVV